MTVMAQANVNTFDQKLLEDPKYYEISDELTEHYEVTDPVEQELIEAASAVQMRNLGINPPINIPVPRPTNPSVPPTNVPTQPTLPTIGDININQVVAIGQVLWKVAEAGRPVVDVNMLAASAVPEGISHWTQLDSWSAPQVKTFVLSYKNYFGMEVVKFVYKVVYTHSGSIKSQGKYLSNMTILPALLDVVMGFDFSASAKVANVTNVGTAEEPMAAGEMHLNYVVKNVFNEKRTTEAYYVRGDGFFKAL